MKTLIRMICRGLKATGIVRAPKLCSDSGLAEKRMAGERRREDQRRAAHMTQVCISEF
jgi:hypothetical protein